MIKNNYFSVLSVRLLIIFGWIAIIAGIVYLPEMLVNKVENKTINVFAWSGVFDLSYIAQFEKQTGIRVNFSYYESNEELLAKLRATKGYGYDLIIPSDYAVNILREEQVLKKLDKSKLSFYNTINPVLLGHYFDPENNYSLPFEWSIFGLGIDREFFRDKKVEPTWGLIFDKQKIPGKIIMSNDPLVAIPLGAFYLYGTLNNLDKTKLEAIKQLLINQKKYVEAYTDFRADYYIATKNCPLVVASSAFMWRSMREYPTIEFIVPKEGTLVTIESCAIPITSQKEDLVYKFLEFTFSQKYMAHNFNQLALFPTTTNIFDDIQASDYIKSLLTISKEDFKRFSFLQFDEFASGITEQDFQDIWVMIKS